jgi:hypothetical protein
MNGTERAYWAYLGLLLAEGSIRRASFEPEKLRLGSDHSCTYTPDFRIVRLDGIIEFHEVKGFWRDDARVKIKVAAEMHPYVFRAVQREGRAWKWESLTLDAPPWPP